ncbi:MAG TPA: hypothetical protein VGV92_04690 [Gammaproteobacteria bacterium]|nr:hypothetical protein [Gammaproteobacteria bacterium]
MKGTSKGSNTGTIKVVLIGNTTPSTNPKGKTIRTALTNIYTGGQNAEGNVITRSIGGRSIEVSLQEIGGQETQTTKLNQQNYTDTDAFLLTFGFGSRPSFDSIKTWFNEAKRSAPNATFVLLGVNESSKATGNAVTTQDAQQLAKELHINAFAQCSLDNPQSVQKAIDQSVTSALDSQG